MKKLIISSLLSLMLMFVCQSVSAGDILKFGIKGGVSVPSSKMVKMPLTGNFSEFSATPNTGYHVGLMARVNFFIFNVQPEIVFNSNTYHVNMLSTAATPTVTNNKIVFNSVEVPVLLGVKLLFLRINAGPVFNVYDKSKAKQNNIDEVDFQIPAVGYQAGIGLDIWKLTLDARYQGNFKKPTQNFLIDGSSPMATGNFSTDKFIFSLGFMF